MKTLYHSKLSKFVRVRLCTFMKKEKLTTSTLSNKIIITLDHIPHFVCCTFEIVIMTRSERKMKHKQLFTTFLKFKACLVTFVHFFFFCVSNDPLALKMLLNMMWQGRGQSKDASKSLPYTWANMWHCMWEQEENPLRLSTNKEHRSGGLLAMLGGKPKEWGSRN